MAWKEVDVMTLRQEFVSLSLQDGANRRQLCERFGISPKTGYKWLERYREQGVSGLVDHSRRPLHSPTRARESIEAEVVALRDRHPSWGGRKLNRRLLDLGRQDVPTPSTITRILHRHDLITPAASERNTHWQRFEHEQANDLWQMDFKGYFETGQATCHPLTVLDDHSRYNLVLHACQRPNREHVQQALTTTFRRYGLPRCINVDNGAPWGSPSKHEHGVTGLTIWLMQLGIWISHSRPNHPQTNGKEERFHRTLKQDVISGQYYDSLSQAQQAFDRWRHVYNHERPHEAIALATPVTRYQPSHRRYPEHLPPVEYASDDIVLSVGWDGKVKYDGYQFRVSNALRTYKIALRPNDQRDGLFDVFFAQQRIGEVDLYQLKR